MNLLPFQVSYIYALAVFEDYLYATHSDPSRGTSSVELLQIHRFNITAESRTLASLGNSQMLRVYHRLTQPKGKGHYVCYMCGNSICQFYLCRIHIFRRIWCLLSKGHCHLIISLSVGYSQSGVIHVNWIPMEDQVDAPICAS